jgi:NitT/TauT family transport system permease protein
LLIPSLQVIPVLLVDVAYSWVRMSVALVLSILFSWAVGIAAARNRTAERLILPALDVLQSIPILGFFPIVLVLFVSTFPLQVGVNLSVVFLIFTSMAWNIAFGVYESVKSIPADYLDLAKIERMSFWSRLTTLYIPSSWGKVAYNSVTSWSVGLFYLVSSEEFSLGSAAGGATYAVSHGIGVDIATFASKLNWNGYVASIVVLVLAVLLTRVFFLSEFSNWAEKFKLGEEARPPRRDAIYRLYSWFNATARLRLFAVLPKVRGTAIPRIRLEVVPPTTLERLARRSKFVALVVVILLASATAYLTLPSLIRERAAIDIGKAASDEGMVLVSLLYSFVRIWYVYIITVAIAVPLGIAVATNRRLFNIATPLLQVVSAVPAPALLPPIALWLGGVAFGGELTAALVIFLGMVWYLLFNIVAGVRSLPSEVLEMARLARLKKLYAWRHVYLPAALPSFVTGSITAIGGAWNTLIIAEYFNVSASGSSLTPLTQVSTGIGRLIDLAAANGDLLLLGLSILSMSAVVITFNILVWRRLYTRTTKRYIYSR